MRRGSGNGPGSPGAPDGDAQSGAPVDCYVLFRGHTDRLACSAR